MTETYAIESADDNVPINPRQLRELRDLLREDDDLDDIGVSLRDRPPAPGEQGAIPVALEIITTVTPLGSAFAGVLIVWLKQHRPSIKISRKGDDYSIKLGAGTVEDAKRLIAFMESRDGAERGTGSVVADEPERQGGAPG